MILSDEILNTHPLLLRELAAQIDNESSLEVLEFGRVVRIVTSALGKSVRLELKQRNENVLVEVEIKKLRKGDENRSGTAKYLDNAKNKALSAAEQPLFYYRRGEVGISEVTIHLAAKLPRMAPYNMIAEIARNIKKVRSKLELQ